MQSPENFSDEEKMSQLMDGEWQQLNPSDCVAKLCGDEALQSKWSRYHLIRDVMKNEPVGIDQKLAARICSAIADEPAYSNITPFNADATSDHQAGHATANPQETDAVYAKASDASASLVKGSVSERQQRGSLVNNSPDKKQDKTPVKTQDKTSDKNQSRRSSLFNTGIAGFALAASVALVTVVGLNLYNSLATEPVPTVAINTLPTETSGDATDGTLTLQVSTIGDSVSNGSNAFSQQVDGAPLPEVELVSNSGTYWVSPDSAQRVADDQRLNTMLSRHLENSPTNGREGLLSYSRLVSFGESAQER